MRIEKIELRYLEGKLSEPFAWAQRWTDTRSVINIKVFTDEGITGWGETFGSLDTIDSIATILSFAIGENPLFINKIWNKIYSATFQSHVFAKSAVFGMSALDTALHDISGKFLKVPVHEILGGKFRDSIAIYATGLYYTDNYSLDPLIKEAEDLSNDGYTGMKMKIGALSLLEDSIRVKEVKNTIGDNIRLMFDANEAYDSSNALEFLKLVKDVDLEWFEEPCASRDDRSNKYVQRNSHIPISGGESLHTRWDFVPRMTDRIFDIFQPDICAVGGISEMYKVGIMAQSMGVKFNPHFWGTGISFAAALHALSVQPLSQISMNNIPYENESVLECDRTPHPVRENLTNNVFIHKNSRIKVPDGYGLGIEVDEKALSDYTVGNMITISNKSDGQRIF